MPKRRAPRSKTYNAWIDMRQRCNNSNAPQYKHYGARGIQVCERWNKYANFLEDMGEAPPGRSLDRINVNDHYTPENCRWATQSQQMRNMRITRRVTIEGKTYVAADLAEQIGVKTDTIVERAKVCKTLDELMSPERRVFTDGLALGGHANGARQRARTHCKNGHEFTEANTYISKEGWRSCRACAAAKEQRRRDRKRA